MQNIEHRHVPRTKLDKLAYIHIEPNNGGIILNVSGEGLGFHSMARVERHGPLRFSLQAQNRRIDVGGELVWTDEVQKIGGLRFTELTSEARNQIRDWMSKSEPGVEERGSTFGSTFLRATSERSTQGAASSSGSSRYFSRALAWVRKTAKLKLSGFSGGLATGFLFSALATLLILVCYGHRRQFGESLIRIGERLAANRDSAHLNQPATSPAVASPASTGSQHALPASTKEVPPQTTVPARTSIPVHSEIPLREPASPARQIPIQHAAGLQTQPEASPAKAPELKSSSIPPTEPELHAGSVAASPPASVPASADPASVSAVSPLMSPPASVANADRGVTPAQSELAAVVHDVVPRNSDSNLQMFFDLGSFKQEQRADGLSDKLLQAGFPASVVRKGHFWGMNSFKVLVGPYNNEVDEKKINGDLRSRGYQPRPFERGSRDFAFRSIVMIKNAKLPIGDLAISWESYVADAQVKFAQGHEVVATADGKWIKKPQKYSRDEYVFGKQADGSHPLLEIHFAGLDRALVFR